MNDLDRMVEDEEPPIRKPKMPEDPLQQIKQIE
jgi:hypothetical protein